MVVNCVMARKKTYFTGRARKAVGTGTWGYSGLCCIREFHQTLMKGWFFGFLVFFELLTQELEFGLGTLGRLNSGLVFGDKMFQLFDLTLVRQLCNSLAK